MSDETKSIRTPLVFFVTNRFKCPFFCHRVLKFIERTYVEKKSFPVSLLTVCSLNYRLTRTEEINIVVLYVVSHTPVRFVSL